MATIRDWQNAAWILAEEKGFHEGRMGTDRDTTLLRLCLVHTEISEAAQEVKRHWKGEPSFEQKFVFGEELADAVIRLLDLAECVGVDLQSAIECKMEKNRGRPANYGTPKEHKGI
jgi:NTP pyrophosphatase (non-canonical NTP hydrolase)